MNELAGSSSQLQYAINPPQTWRAPGFVATILIVIAIRGLVLGTGFVSMAVVAPDQVPPFNRDHPWLAWDALHYHYIAESGYATQRGGTQFDDGYSYKVIAYFPLVPLVNRALAIVMPLHAAMILFSNVCALIGFCFAYDWARRLAGAHAATLCVLLIATFPGSVSMAAGLTEGPFLMFVAMTLWLLQRDQFYFAAIVAGMATASRPTGVALAMVVPLYAWLRMPQAALSKRIATLIFTGLISFSGICLYEAFLWNRYGTPTAYSEAQQIWDIKNQERLYWESTEGIRRYSWEFFRSRLTRPSTWNRGAALVIFIITVVGFVKPMGIPRLLFLLPLVIFLMTTLPGRFLRVSSVPRYECAAIPLFLLPAIWLCRDRWRAILALVLIGQFAVQLYYAYLFPRELWVG